MDAEQVLNEGNREILFSEYQVYQAQQEGSELKTYRLGVQLTSSQNNLKLRELKIAGLEKSLLATQQQLKEEKKNFENKLKEFQVNKKINDNLNNENIEDLNRKVGVLVKK